jgi:uroporphyrin-III C-methyltransferase/precorrin-2 dehydrogenase/sirohydrochlorin ferrochelatase
VWVNVSDDPELCTFHLPARVRRGPLQITVGSSGEAPFVVRRLRQLFERRFGPEWGEWLEAAARFRRSVRRLGFEPERREKLYERFFADTVDGERLRARVPTAAEEREWLDAPTEDHYAPSPADGDRAAAQPDSGPGFVSLVGAGPGCPGLLTVRGLSRLLAADAVVYDRLAASALPTGLDPRVELHPVGKTAGNHPVPQGEINALLVRLARSGLKVVRLKGGDPYVFGRGGEEAEALASAAIPFEVVPGVTSGVAAPACVGIPVTHRRESVRVTLLTAHETSKSDGPQVRWDLLAQDPHATLVGYMGVTALPTVVERLVAGGMDPATPAAVVEQGTTAAQRRVISTLAELPAAAVAAGIGPPALFVIGPTVRHAARLDWLARLPLAGRRLLVPATSTELIGALEAAGAEVVAVPLPVTPAARVVMAALPLQGCVVTSAAEVDWLDDERGSPGWVEGTVAWCLGEDAAARARAYAWARCEVVDPGLGSDELVTRIAAGSGESARGDDSGR